jgi:hypothetical protein
MLFAVLPPHRFGRFLPAVERFGTRVGGPRYQEARFHSDRLNGNDADVDRQGPGRPIEGRGPWTHR